MVSSGLLSHRTKRQGPVSVGIKKKKKREKEKEKEKEKRKLEKTANGLGDAVQATLAGGIALG